MSDYHEDGHHVGRNNNSLSSQSVRQGFSGCPRPAISFESSHGDTETRYDPVERQRQELAQIDAMLRGDRHL